MAASNHVDAKVGSFTLQYSILEKSVTGGDNGRLPRTVIVFTTYKQHYLKTDFTALGLTNALKINAIVGDAIKAQLRRRSWKITYN